MADAVHFATHEDAFTPANSSGFNGFPAPFVSAPTAVDFFPAAFPFPQLMQLFWRAKAFTLTTDAAVTAGADTQSLDSGLLVGGFHDGGNVAMTRELDHVTFLGGTVGPSAILGISSSGPGSGAGNFYLFNGSNQSSNCPVILFDGSDHFPRMDLIANIAVTDGVTGDIAQLSMLLDPAFGYTSTIAASLDGVAFDLLYNFSGDPGTSFTFTQFDLTISEFWPYAAANGSPIFDTTTGAQLQDPRN